LSENSKYKFGNGISITTGFDVSTQLPLDSRTVVQTQADLENISDSIKYEGLLVFVVDQNKLYQWKQELLEDGTYTPDYRWGPIESEISAKKIEDISELDLDNIKSLQMQKNKVNFFPITHEKFIYNEKGETLFEELKEYQKKDLSAEEGGEKLETEMQTIVGAINELNSKMDDTIEDFEKKINQTIEELNANVDKMQKETSADMEAMKSNLQTEINKVLADLDAKSKEMDEEFAELLRKVDKQVSDLQENIQDDINQMLQDVDNSILSDGQVIDLMNQINANITAIESK
jgi:flagellar hook-basal body complex protein FliE